MERNNIACFLGPRPRETKEWVWNACPRGAAGTPPHLSVPEKVGGGPEGQPEAQVGSLITPLPPTARDSRSSRSGRFGCPPGWPPQSRSHLTDSGDAENWSLWFLYFLSTGTNELGLGMVLFTMSRGGDGMGQRRRSEQEKAHRKNSGNPQPTARPGPAPSGPG